ncbi:CPBP family intramembrane glutamic endopeptidase [Paenibacillus arenilitoris]|uniref:CPBP family intramembrane metalloprotease n=1 Tax=Paenibacillus arenilitoris TaxID=2772299 RepID=A0A927CR67_9BACL|nr:CPBP family intramembrane glutamic endopeptidase [Paenibacillus arenilitoris]MBD2871328.1 CPBP family intramembrane metalloprotease [Paenibacillus arenilitoris]
MGILQAIMGFLILDLYFNLIPHLIPLGTVPWLVYAIGFFVLAHHVAKLTGLDGIGSLGVSSHYGWKRNLRIGIAYGSVLWAMMYTLLWLFGDFRVTGVKAAPEAVILLIEALAVMFLGSLINDLIVRGYVFAHLKGKMRAGLLLLLSSAIYAADDVWLAGFSMQNAIFSMILGLSLGYALLETGSIWLSTGIHWGLNAMYCLVHGIPGREEAKGLLLAEQGTSGASMLDNAHIIAAALLFIALFITFGRLRVNRVN